MQTEICPIIKVDDPDAGSASVLVTIRSKRAGKTDTFAVPRQLNGKPITTDDSCEIGWSGTGGVVYTTIHERIVGPAFNGRLHADQLAAIAAERNSLHERQRRVAA